MFLCFIDLGYLLFCVFFNHDEPGHVHRAPAVENVPADQDAPAG